MKTSLTTLILLLGLTLAATNQMSSLYSDHKSFSVGDILTVFISESSSASSSAGSETDKSFDHKIGSAAGQGPLDFIPLSSAGFNSSNSSKGDAKTSRKGDLSTTITVKVIEVQENGNLIVSGSRSIKINGEEEITTIEGIVRPQDISADNKVYSFNIADAKITYKGKGAGKDATRIGFLSRIFNFLF